MRIIKVLAFNFLLISGLSAMGQETNETSSTYRGKATAVVNASPQLTELLKARFASKNNSNYKIQLYYGSLNKAHSVLNKFNNKYNQWSGKIQYETPNYKVWVGNYQTRIAADKALMAINKSFPHAFVFKP